MYFLIFINCISVFGFATFVKHPDLLARYQWSPPIFAVSYPLFAQLQIACGFLVVSYACLQSFGKKLTLRLFFSAALISFCMELLSTTYGIPFGKYSYTSLLGWQIFGHVPFWIPVSWFCMSIVSWVMAGQILGNQSTAFFKVLLGSVLLLTWDMTLDPAMSQLTPYWVWEQPANFLLNMPVRNLGGWFLTGCLIMTSFHFLQPKKSPLTMQGQFPLKFYLANLLLPVGFAVVGHLWFPLLITATVGLSCLGLAQCLRSAEKLESNP